MRAPDTSVSFEEFAHARSGSLMRTGELRVLPGSTVSNGNRTGLAFGWLGGTDQLLAVQTGSSQRAQIGYWRPGSSALRVSCLWQPPGMTVVAGPYG
jgi:hypothetical protein